jgi:putative tryptophan/tyrosine transport system substrate-binding protein
MRRRDFIKGIAGSTVAWPLAARAQRVGKLPSIGFLGPTSTQAWLPSWTAALESRLGELGWIKDRTIAIEYRWAEGHSERLAEIAAEFTRLEVNVIVALGTQSALAARRATDVVPIVFVSVGDPMGTGLVESLAHPGGNATGLSNQSSDLAGKRLEVLTEGVFGLHRLGILINAENAASVLEMGEVQTAARNLGLTVVTSEVRSGKDIAPAVEALTGRVDALYIVPDPLFGAYRLEFKNYAARLPMMVGLPDPVEAGIALMSYAPNQRDLFRRAADFVDKILRGVRPGDISVEQPTKFELVVNLTVAKALGLKIPESFLVRADEVID